jgi:CRP-like cAMP-binding protein
MLVRLRAAGLADENRCLLPLTKGEIGDALGLSTMHVNRTLQQLRGANLITLTKMHLTVNDWEGLTTLGELDPTYLPQQPREAA